MGVKIFFKPLEKKKLNYEWFNEIWLNKGVAYIINTHKEWEEFVGYISGKFTSNDGEYGYLGQIAKEDLNECLIHIGIKTKKQFGYFFYLIMEYGRIKEENMLDDDFYSKNDVPFARLLEYGDDFDIKDSFDSEEDFLLDNLLSLSDSELDEYFEEIFKTKSNVLIVNKTIIIKKIMRIDFIVTEKEISVFCNDNIDESIIAKLLETNMYIQNEKICVMEKEQADKMQKIIEQGFVDV